MKRTNIAGTELDSSSLSLGGVALGSKLDEEQSFRLMDAYVDFGGNMVDTAQVYANWLPIEPSVSERTIGKWMKLRGNRSRLIVTTKGAHPDLSTMQVSRLSREEIASDIEGSLRRLQVDCIDLYWLHRDDPAKDAGEIIESLNEQAKAGNIRYFGCSNWSAARIREAQAYAAARGLQGFAANQMMWSLAEVDRSKQGDPTLVAMDEETMRLHTETGIAAIPYSSQAQGIFSKLASGALTFDDEKLAPMYRTDGNRRRLERIKQLAAERSLTIAQVVLGYLLSQPFPTIPIVGCYTVEQLQECVEADAVRLSEEQLAFLVK
ncbi:aldo/keto reductase [Paenibacillus sp.]|uniref:aldo/keto reductase n=1 Tax=Paenibacillus sp. TaxID=58172 RepID=UPI002D36F189|nr:aldo/keto reductase [Paenibacillus sp.]HZG86342.1 aldo/keto reductase [Paenibacillus sp.]